jgi:hypothetical protein
MEAMRDDQQTARLHEQQARRERDEREYADRARNPEERHTHERRSAKAEYLRHKLEEQARSRRS